MNEKMYIIATDASSYQTNTKHGVIWVSCSSVTVIDYETNELLGTKSYILVDEAINFAEAFAINMALFDFTNPAIPENRGAIIYSDSTYALGETLDILTQFINGEKRPKGLKPANGFKHLCYNNALLAYSSFYPLQFRYQPAHPEKMSYNYKDISLKAAHENDKLGLVTTNMDNGCKSIRQPSFGNQMSDRISNCILFNKIKGIREVINNMESIPDRKSRYFPLRFYANEIQSLTPICYREDKLSILGIRPEVVQPAFHIKNKPMIEGVKLNGNPL
jgi:hypothetical protein